MIKALFRISLLSLTALLLVHCAKSEDQDTKAIQQESFDSWMQIHKGGEIASGKIIRYDNGMYMEWLRPSVEGGQKPATPAWLQLNYRGYTLQNSVFMTRYPEEAEKEGTFSLYTHYVPHYTMYYANMGFTQGEIFGLSQMVKDDSVRMYIPPALAYGKGGLTNSYSYGYAGSLSSLGSNKPVIIEMVIKDIIEDELLFEQRQVEAVAEDWGMSSSDSLSKGIYLQILREDTSQEVILADSTAYIEYVGRFLDGFLFQTNVDSIRIAEWDNYSKQNPYNYKVSKYTTPTFPSGAFLEVFSSEKMRYKSKARFVFTSDWAYGRNGQDATQTQPVVYPYTPLMFEVRVLKKGFDIDEDDKNEDA